MTGSVIACDLVFIEKISPSTGKGESPFVVAWTPIFSPLWTTIFTVKIIELIEKQAKKSSFNIEPLITIFCIYVLLTTANFYSKLKHLSQMQSYQNQPH